MERPCDVLQWQSGVLQTRALRGQRWAYPREGSVLPGVTPLSGGVARLSRAGQSKGNAVRITAAA